MVVVAVDEHERHGRAPALQLQRLVRLRATAHRRPPGERRERAAGVCARRGSRAALGSLFKMHNETFNVWTHLIGLVWCVNKLAQTLTTVPCGARATAAIAVFLASACCCFACSATYHLIGTALPPGASAAMLKIDIVGIVTLIAGSWAPGLEFTIGRRAPLNAIAYLTTSAAFMVAALRVRVRDDDRVSMRVVCLVLSVCAGALPLEYHVRRSSSVGSSFDASAASFI